MKIKILMIFLLAGLAGFAQDNTNPLDPAKVRKLKLLKTSPQESIAMFGTPTHKETKEESQKFIFQNDDASLFLEFNKNNILSSYHFMRNYPGALVNIDYVKARNIVAGKTTPEEIKKLFGEKSQIEITTREEKWYFNKGAAQLVVNFLTDQPEKVSDFAYTETFPKSENVPDEKLEMLTKREISTQEELVAQFGVPKQKRITADKEEWEYRSGFMKVQIRFDKATGKIKNYLYQPSGKIPAENQQKSH